ncbi:MAG: hypothetical protein L6V85_03195 [Clostridiales bacterium]|nr:MAG: hypothetical protein L6V85_03195 [Clostridiales bacterium]
MEIFERAKGKINLTLDITGESGGFHLLDMLVATIDLFDDVKITYRADDKIECVQDGEIADEKNSAYRAAKLMQDTFKTRGFTVEITKRIPLAGGLGGSCADGVAVVRGIEKNAGNKSRFYHAGVFLLKVGSDAPSMYFDGIKRVRGIGDKVDFIDIKLPYKVGFLAENEVDTTACFKMYDDMKLCGGNSTEQLIKEFSKGNANVTNMLKKTTCFFLLSGKKSRRQKKRMKES